MNRREGFGSGRQGRGAGRTNARTNVWQHIDGSDQRGHDYGSYESDHSGLPQHDPVPRGSDRREEFNRIAAERSDERDDWRKPGGRNFDFKNDSYAGGSSSSNWDRAA